MWYFKHHDEEQKELAARKARGMAWKMHTLQRHVGIAPPSETLKPPSSKGPE